MAFIISFNAFLLEGQVSFDLKTGAVSTVYNNVWIPGRVTYVADRSGKVVYIFDSQTETQRHADEALKICLLLKRTDNVKTDLPFLSATRNS